MPVFPQLFRVLPNFHECFHKSKETQRTCFLFLLENTVARKRTTTCQLWWSKCKFISLVTIFKKNTILVWNLLRIIVSTLGAEVCQASKVFFNAKRAFVDDTRIIKIYAMAEWPRMFRNVWSIGTCFDIPHMFFASSFPRKKNFYSTLQYMLPMSFSSDVIFFMSSLNFAASKDKSWLNKFYRSWSQTDISLLQATKKCIPKKTSEIYTRTFTRPAQMRICYKPWPLRLKPYS